MELWNRVCVTDPSAVKPITGKQYKGNSPKPYWLIQRATEELGPCGIGWGVSVLNERFERLTETDVLHVAMVEVWYVMDGKRGAIQQMGQTKAAYMSKNGQMVDEDAPKKSITDGMVKCMSMLGFAGDIFSGQWDDSKYVEWAGEQYHPKPDYIKAMSLCESFDDLKRVFAEGWKATNGDPQIKKAYEAKKKEFEHVTT
jgi:hypothetical protein